MGFITYGFATVWADWWELDESMDWKPEANRSDEGDSTL